MSNLLLYSDLPSCSNTLATCGEELIHWKRPWCWERLRAGGEGGDRGWVGWTGSLTQWTWVWASSGRWRRTGKTGRLQSIGSQRVGHDLATEWQVLSKMSFVVSLFRRRFSQRPSIMLGVLVAKVSQSWLQTTSLPTIGHHTLPQPCEPANPNTLWGIFSSHAPALEGLCFFNWFIFGCAGSSLLHVGFLHLWCASHHSVFSCCRTQALGSAGFSSCVTQA